MQLQHVNSKIFVDGELSVDPEQFIDVFHRWIQQSAVDGLLIDVADYRHVPSGPSVLLIGHEADYGIDQTDGRFGMIYNRKAPLEGSNSDRLRQALRAVAKACEKMESEFAHAPSLKFNRNELKLWINDRALAPNTPETWAACKPEIDACLAELLGDGEFTLTPEKEPRRCFGLHVQCAKPLDLEALALLSHK